MDSTVSEIYPKEENGSPLDTESKTKTTEGTIQERIEEFSKILVKSFEFKISEYKKEAAVGGNPKIGKTAKLLLSPIKSAGTAVGLGTSLTTGVTIPSAATKSSGEAGSVVADYLYGKHHRAKAKQVIKIIALMNKDELRRILLEAAFDIFASFEEQFSEVTSADGSWMKAMEKLAVESVDRSINYIKDFESNNPFVKAVTNREFIIKSVLYGESKKGIGAQIGNPLKLSKLEKVHVLPEKVKNRIPKSGHTLLYKRDEWKISDLFKGVGVVKLDENGNCDKYFRKRYGDKADKYKYRLLFHWETDETYRKYVKPKDIYKYTLKKEDLAKTLLDVLSDINNNDADRSHIIINETNALVNKIQEKVEDISDTCTETGEEMHVVHKKVDEVQETSKATMHATYQNQQKLSEILDIEKDFNINLQIISKTTCDTNVKISEIKSSTTEFIGLQNKGNVLQELAECTNSTVTETHGTVNQILDIVQSQDFNKWSIEKEKVCFNVWPPNSYFVGRDKQLCDIHSLMQGDGETVISQITVVAGLGGVGKTELIRKYVSINKELYENVVWILAESYEVICESFRELGQEILYPDKRNKEEFIKSLGMKTIVKDIYKYFSGTKSLFVFDNAEKFKSLKHGDEGINIFLPLTAEYVNKIFILISSRNQKWGAIKVFKLDVFKDYESKIFIKKALSINDDSQDTEIRSLAEMLQNLPLALQLAVTYIREMNTVYENSNSKFSIADYIKKFKKQREDLLDYEFFLNDDSTDNYNKTVFTTWKITVDTIQSDEKYGRKAKEILDAIAYIAPNSIFTSLFSKHFTTDDEIMNFGFALQLLKQYSMVNSAKCMTEFEVHRLVQEVTRIRLKLDNEEGKVMAIVFKLLKDYLTSNSISLEELFEEETMASHMEIFLSHVEKSTNTNDKTNRTYKRQLFVWIADKYKWTDDERSAEMLDRILELPEEEEFDLNDGYIFDVVSKVYGRLHNPEKERKVLYRALVIKEKHYGSQSLEFAETLQRLSETHNWRDDQKRILLKRCLEIQEHHFGYNSVELVPVLEKLSLFHGNVANTMDEINLQERILKITEENKGVVHYDVYLVLKKLYLAYGSLFDTQKQKELLERMLYIQENSPGGDNYIVETLTNLSSVYKQLGESDKQMEALERALEIRIREYGPRHEKVSKIQYLILTAAWTGFN